MTSSRFSYLKIVLVFFLVVTAAPLFPHHARADWQCWDWEWNWDEYQQECYNWQYVDDNAPAPDPDPAPVAPTLTSNTSGSGTAQVCNGGYYCTTVSLADALTQMQLLLDAAYGEANYSGQNCWYDEYGNSDCQNFYYPPPVMTYDSQGRLTSVTCGNGAVLTATYYDVSAACSSPANDCGQTNTGSSINGGACSATTPPDPAGYGSGCTSANSCGQTNSGSIQCDGSCSAGAPADPSNLGQACDSAPNSCGQTQANGTYQCDGSCSSTPPSDAGCNQPPNTPQLWGLYDGVTGTYYGTTAPAYNAHGYQLYANATDPNSDNVALYFQWSGISAEWGSGPWVGSGAWSYDTNLANAAPGTYWVYVSAMDSHGAWGPGTGWVQLTLVAGAAGSCASTHYGCTVGTSGNNVNNVTSWTWTCAGSNGGGTASCSETGPCYGQGCNGGGGCSYPGISQPSGTASQCCSPSAGVCPAAPVATLSADALDVNIGQSTTLHWSCTNATSYSGNGPIGSHAWPGVSSISTGVLNSAGAQPYQITCSGAGGTSPITNVSVNVHAPSATINANPARVSPAPGNTTTLTWSGTDVTSCVVSGPGVSVSGSASGSGSFTAQSPKTVTITGQSVYTITCQTAGGSPVTKSVTVTVPPGFTEF